MLVSVKKANKATQGSTPFSTLIFDSFKYILSKVWADPFDLLT